MITYTIFYKLNGGEELKYVVHLSTGNPSTSGARSKFKKDKKGIKGITIVTIKTGEF